MLVSERITFREAEIRFFGLIKEYPDLRKIPNKEKLELIQIWPTIRKAYYNDGVRLKGEKKFLCDRLNHMSPRHKRSTPKIPYINEGKKILHCLRCGHSWKPIKRTIRMCPKCKSLLWNQSKG